VLFALTLFLVVCATRSLVFLLAAPYSKIEFGFKTNGLPSQTRVKWPFLENPLKKDTQHVLKNDLMGDRTGQKICAGGKEEIVKEENSNDAYVGRLSPYPNSHTPFISVLIASYNENIVMEKLLLSVSNLDYDFDKFEIVVVDDSNDGTPAILKDWEKRLSNLKVICRKNRSGWKGGALDIGMKHLNDKSEFVLVVDADNVLRANTLKKIASSFSSIQNKENAITSVIQGYPIPTVGVGPDRFMGAKYKTQSPKPVDAYGEDSDGNNWVSRGLSLRLSQRNLIEFVAKEKLGLPLPITGSLFSIRTSVLKAIRFSHDLCEDWDLTLDLYLSKFIKNKYDGDSDFHRGEEHHRHNEGTLRNFCKPASNKNTISFNPDIASFSETTTKGKAYFNQRMRVSEGHTRGFRKRAIKILKSNNLSFIYKLELFLMGLRYAKYIPIVCLIIFDFLMLCGKGYDYIIRDNAIKLLMGLQGLSLFMYLAYNTASINLLWKKKEPYGYRDMLCLLLLNLYTVPAFVIGSVLGLVRSKGSFYRTTRNEEMAVGQKP
jgi:cellulose synthase/poly-beta-1,6-N-acetylglucosamine synthase-like glycosyltransferase